MESGKFEDLKSSHFDDVNQSEEAVYELLDWYEDNLLFCDLDDDFRACLTSDFCRGRTIQFRVEAVLQRLVPYMKMEHGGPCMQ